MEEIKEILLEVWKKQKKQIIFIGVIIVLAIIASFVKL